MGASSSTQQVSTEQREAETLAASTGALPMLQKSFSRLSNPETKAIPLTSLQVKFSLKKTRNFGFDFVPETLSACPVLYLWLN